MKREQVKILLTHTDEELKILGYDGLVEHRKIAEYYACGGRIQYKGGEYKEEATNPEFTLYVEYEEVPPKVKVFGVEIEANPPETEPLAKNQTYYHLSPCSIDGYLTTTWTDFDFDNICLQRKIIFLDEDNIKAVVKGLGWSK